MTTSKALTSTNNRLVVSSSIKKSDLSIKRTVSIPFIKMCRSSITSDSSRIKVDSETSTKLSQFDNSVSDSFHSGSCHRDSSNNKSTHECKIPLRNAKLKVIVNNKVVTLFPLQIYDLLSHGNSMFFKWNNHGSQFTIQTKNEEKVNLTLRRFMLPKLSSFIRKLYTFGWRQIQRTKVQCTFYHPLFHKCADLCDIAKIVPKKPTVSPSSLESSGVLMSPISADFVASCRYDILFSPVETSLDIFQCNEEIDGSLNGNHMFDKYQSFVEVSNGCENDGESELSVPVIPLTNK